jgi:DNA-binding GntR family transcriptional regulator
VQVDVRASLLHESIAEELQVAPQSPSLLVVRRYVGQSRRVFEISMSQHPAERYSFSMELRRGWKADGGWAAS